MSDLIPANESSVETELMKIKAELLTIKLIGSIQNVSSPSVYL
jgi:hypothetical protein